MDRLNITAVVNRSPADADLQLANSSLSSRLAVYVLSALLAGQPLLVSAQNIVVQSEGTQLVNAQNGVPVINIAAPTAKGVSHNQFQQYNVDQQGLILNNAKIISRTQLGGYIEANPNLNGSNAASLIINEVTAPNRSYLNGFTEIGGQSAAVVIANPYGISCNGCGFINTPRATLTTGRPEFSNGALTGLTVTGGDISIDGLGLNAGAVSQFDIITRAVKVNADIHARDLNFVLGSNRVDYNALAATAIDSNNSIEFALDSSALGGMYANAIRLVGTESGVGVRTLGDVAADAGDLTLSADGKISLGKTYAAGEMTLRSVSAGIELDQDVFSTGKMTLQANTSIDNSGHLSSGQNLTLQADSLNNGPDSAILSAGAIEITAQTVDNHQANISAEGALNIAANALRNRDGAGMQGSSVVMSINGDLSNRDATISSTGTMNVAAGNLENNSGTIFASGDATLSGGQINNQGNLQAANTLTVTASSLNNAADAVIDAATTELRAANTINNGGHIEGDTLTIVSTDFNNEGQILGNGVSLTTQNLKNTGAQAFVGATQQLDLLVQNRLENTDNALIYSLGDLLMAADAQQGRTELVLNSSANIEADGNLAIYSNTLNNQKALFVTELQEVSRTPIVKSYLPYAERMALWHKYWPNIYGKYTVERVWKEGDIVVSETAVTQDSQRSLIRSANNLDLHVTGTLTNAYSDIVAGNDLNFDVGVLNNVAQTKETKTEKQGRYAARIYKTKDGQCHGAYGTDIYLDCNGYAALTEQSSTFSPLVGGEAVFAANQTISGSAWTVNNINTNQSAAADGNNLGAVGAMPFTFSLPDSGLFSLRPEPQSQYLVETSPRFASFGQFISSDYMLQRLDLDPERIPKRLGDGFYEQRLVQEQLRQKTGQYASGNQVAMAQYSDLMDAGLAAAQSLNLTPYVALTEDQIAALTQNIVWLESQTVTLADGSIADVLVPRVYLANIQGETLTRGGAIIAGNEVRLTLDETLTNSGIIESGGNITVAANDINNLGGAMLSNGDNNLSARHDINNQSGVIRGNNINLTAAGSINHSTTVANFGGKNRASQARGNLQADNNLTMTAADTININAADINAGQSIALTAGDSINITTSQARNHQGYQDSTRHEQSTVSTGGVMTLDAANDITINGSTVAANDDLSLTAGQNISISASENRRDISYVGNNSRLILNEGIHTASTLSSNQDVSIQAGNDLKVMGSDISARGDIQTQAQGDTTVTSVQDIYYFYSHYKQKKSFGRSKSVTIEQERYRNKASHLTAGGDVLINTVNSGNDEPSFIVAADTEANYPGETAATENTLPASTSAGNVSLVGSDIRAQGDIAIYAGETISAAPGVDYDYSRVEVSKKGFGGLTGSNRKTISQQQRQQQATVGSGADINLNAGRNVTLIAPKISGQGDIDINAGTGTVTLATAKDIDYQHEEYSKTGSFSWESGNKGHLDQSIRHTEITAGGNITIDAGNGVIVEYKQNGNLDESITTLSQLPEFAWMAELKQRDDIDWQAIEEAHEEWQQHDEGLGGPGFTLVAIAVAIASGGAGAGLVGETAIGSTATAAGVAQAAVIDSLINQAAMSLIVNKGDIGAVFKDLTSKEGLMSLATAGATAGITNSLTESLDLKLPADGKTFKLAERMQRGIISSGVNSTVTTALNGGNLGDNLLASFKGVTLNNLATETIGMIGDLEVKSEGKIQEGDLIKVLSHAAVGCAAQSLAGGNCSAGALGAATAELLAPHMTQAELGKVQSELTVALTSGIAALVTGEDLESAMTAALQTERFNRQLHAKERQLIKSLANDKASASCGEDAGCINSVRNYWAEIYEHVGESNVDDYEAARTAEYLTALHATQNNPDSEVNWNAATAAEYDQYFSDINTARAELSAYEGQVIAGTGGQQHYFSATTEQRADRTINTPLDMGVSGSDASNDLTVGRTIRDELRLERFSATNGGATPDYIVEEFVLADGLAKGVAKVLGRVDDFAVGTGKVTTQGGNVVPNSAASQLAKNKAAGDAFEKQVMGQLQQTQSGVVQQVTVKTQSGVRTRIDLMGRDANGNIVCTECKASATAPLTKNQTAAFPEIQQTGATVVGQGKPGFPGGTQIPPTTLNIVRP